MTPDNRFRESDFQNPERRVFGHSQSEVSWHEYTSPNNYLICLEEWVSNPNKLRPYPTETRGRSFRAEFTPECKKLRLLEVFDGDKEIRIEFFTNHILYYVKQGKLGVEGYFDQQDSNNNDFGPYSFWSLTANFRFNNDKNSPTELILIPKLNIGKAIYLTSSISDKNLDYTHTWELSATTTEEAWQTGEIKDSLIAQHPFRPHIGLEMVDLLEITRRVREQKALFVFKRTPETRPITRPYTTEEIAYLNRTTIDQVAIEIPPVLPNINPILNTQDGRNQLDRALDAIATLDSYFFPIMKSFTTSSITIT